ncbi:DNA translocase FtsK [Fastidiosipila sanguinis]|nr:DNA translocase FtsK [Fastidiosipila sanguinis]
MTNREEYFRKQNNTNNKAREIIGLIYLILSLFTGVAFYIPSVSSGPLGHFVVSVGRGLLGPISYALPLLFLVLAISTFLEDFFKAKKIRINNLLLLLILLSALIHSISIKPEVVKSLSVDSEGKYTVLNSFSTLWLMGKSPETFTSITADLSGGIIGGSIALGLQRIIGYAGAIIILSSTIIIEAIIIGNFSISRILLTILSIIYAIVDFCKKAIRNTNASIKESRARKAEFNARTKEISNQERQDNYYDKGFPKAQPAETKSLQQRVNTNMSQVNQRKSFNIDSYMSDFNNHGNEEMRKDVPNYDLGANANFNNAGERIPSHIINSDKTYVAPNFIIQQDNEARKNKISNNNSNNIKLKPVRDFTNNQNTAFPETTNSTSDFTIDGLSENHNNHNISSKNSDFLLANDNEDIDTTIEHELNHKKDDLKSNRSNSDLAKDSSVNKVSEKTNSNRVKEEEKAKNISDENSADKEIKKVVPVNKPYVFPPYNLLEARPVQQKGATEKIIKEQAMLLEQTLSSFGVEATVIHVTTGPSITRFELRPGIGVKISKIVNLSDDLALALAATTVRIEAPIPGKSAIGIEIPNESTATVGLRSLIDNPKYVERKERLLVPLGRDIPGQAIYCNLAKMPHLLIAGATGSGKSVCINTILISLLYRCSPEDLKLLLIDPKVVELSIYNGIPHLLAPVVTDPTKAANTLNWLVQEMERRYSLFAEKKARDMNSYNEIMESEGEEKLPNIVLIIDELSDLMMTTPKEVEDSISRLTAMARAAGIHLIIATQRPSVDVITGVIKANIPSRVAFAVSSQVDSRTILDSSGAEKLLGKGDMLYFPQSDSKPTRGQGAFLDDHEVQRVIDFCKSQGLDTYDQEVAQEIVSTKSGGFNDDESDDEEDELFNEAVDLVVENGYASVSLLQRRLNIGYPRAGRIIDAMEAKGYIGPHAGSKPRNIIISSEEWALIKADAWNNEN